MDNQRCPEGYAVVVHSRAEAYPLQGWFERRQRPPSGTPLASRGPAAPDPPVVSGHHRQETTLPHAEERQETSDHVVRGPKRQPECGPIAP